MLKTDIFMSRLTGYRFYLVRAQNIFMINRINTIKRLSKCTNSKHQYYDFVGREQGFTFTKNRWSRSDD